MSRSSRMCMRRSLWLIILLLSLGKTYADERNLFNDAWRFYRGDMPQAIHPEYDDEHWRMVDLPHDWHLTPDSLSSIAASADTVGWYRKTFTIAPSDTARNVYLYFERIHGKAEIWLNDTLIHSTSCSYEPIKIDVTPYLADPYRLNHLAIRVANSPTDSTIYHGAGITHDTWVIRTDRIHLDAWETRVKTNQVYSRRGKWHADLQVSTQIRNTSAAQGEGWLRLLITDPEGSEVYDKQHAILLTDSTTFATKVTLRNPTSWYAATPDMYRAHLYVGTDETTCDSIAIPFGISAIAYSSETGLLHNDEWPLIQGSTLEYNNRFTGYTAFRRAEELLAGHMQYNGYTAIRCPMGLLSEHLLNACDTLGVMVLVDAFSPIHADEQWSDAATASLVKQYRNHPSIIMWCVSDDSHERQLISTVDDSRPIASTDLLLDYRWSDERRSQGEKTPRAYQLDAERLVSCITMGVSAPDTLQTDSTIWLPEEQHWTWPGYEGKVMKVNVYSQSDWVTLYLNDRMIGNTKLGKRAHQATYYVPYEPGQLDAVTSFDPRQLWQPRISRNKVKLSGRFKSHFLFYTTGEPTFFYMSSDRLKATNANGELCFVKIEVLDADGNVIPDAEIPLKLRIRGPGVIISAGNSREISPSIHSVTTCQGSAFVVIRPLKKEVGTIRLTATLDELDIADTTIEVVE